MDSGAGRGGGESRPEVVSHSEDSSPGSGSYVGFAVTFADAALWFPARSYATT